MRLSGTLVASLLALGLSGQAPAGDKAPAPAPAAPATTEQPAKTSVYEPVVYEARILARYPHDESAYTQGLLWHEGALYESTGRVGQSVVRRVDLATGEVLAESAIPAHHFGEGLALWGDEFVSLTWRDGAVHRWSLDGLKPLASREDFPFEGWGITTAEDGLIFSDGSATLRVIDPVTYEVRRSIAVTLKGRPLRLLNELEFIEGRVWANIWQTPYIAVVNPDSGVVEALVDASGLVAEIAPSTRDDVLNGIAWDARERRIFVTGKLWPTVFEIALEPTTKRVR